MLEDKPLIVIDISVAHIQEQLPYLGRKQFGMDLAFAAETIDKIIFSSFLADTMKEA